MPVPGSKPKASKTKRKVLIPIYAIEDLGGIINWTEHLFQGLVDNGCEVSLVRLEDKFVCKARGEYTSVRKLVKTYSGVSHDQRWGWYFPRNARIPILTIDWKKYTSQYDLVIWAVPVPSRVKLFRDWETLYDIKTPQVMVIHDSNLNTMYPHAYKVIPKCTQIIGVHNCAYSSINAPNKSFIPNPQVRRFASIDYGKRFNSVFSIQIFKKLKRVDDLVRAVPHMKSKLILAGGGIEYYYMTSKSKRKEQYGRIWEEAVAAGMRFIGALDEETRDDYLHLSKLLVDPSWSKGSKEHGGYFNRVFVEAIIGGCLPAARDLLIADNGYFSPEDYVTIPWNATPEEFAAIVDEAVATPEKEYVRRIESMREVVDTYFDATKVAAQYLEFCS